MIINFTQKMFVKNNDFRLGGMRSIGTCVVTPSMLDINKGGSSSPPANKELDLSTVTALEPLDKLL